MSETVSTTHLPNVYTCIYPGLLLTTYVYTISKVDAIGIYPGDRRDLAAVYRREESKKWSYKLSNNIIPKSGFYAATWCLCSKGLG